MARAGKKEGGWGEGIFARPRFPIPIFFCRRRISYFALRNAPPRILFARIHFICYHIYEGLYKHPY